MIRTSRGGGFVRAAGAPARVWAAFALMPACVCVADITMVESTFTVAEFEDISLTGTNLGLNSPGDCANIFTTIGNDAFPPGQIKICYPFTISSGAGGSVTVQPHTPIPSGNLFDGKTAMAVLWDSPGQGLPGTGVFYQDFGDHYTVLWLNIPCTNAGGGQAPTTAEVKVYDNGALLARYAEMLYRNVNNVGAQQGRFSTIGYQAGETGQVNFQWSFNQPSVQNFTKLTLLDFAVCNADVTGDGVTDQSDVFCLITVIAGGPTQCLRTGYDPDFNRDGNVDQGDVESLINVIAGGNCPP